MSLLVTPVTFISLTVSLPFKSFTTIVSFVLYSYVFVKTLLFSDKLHPCLYNFWISSSDVTVTFINPVELSNLYSTLTFGAFTSAFLISTTVSLA